MAQLPPKPKAPNMTQNWHSLPLQMMPHVISNTTAAPPPSWVDEFLDFSAARRGAHRRSENDSIAFLPLLEDCPTSPPPPPPRTTAVHGNPTGGFERLEDEQLMSMFADDVAMKVGPLVSPSDHPSTPSDQKSNEEEKALPPPPPPPPPQLDHRKQQRPKEEPREVDGSCIIEPPRPPTGGKPSSTAAGDSIVDLKRVKRILANRQSAQRSRVRKLQYISELERSVTTLQTEVSALSPRVAFFDHQRLILNVDNSTLKQRIAALIQDKIFKDAHQEALRKEIERLRQVYRDQNINKMDTTAGAAASAVPAPPPTAHDNRCTEEDQLLNRDCKADKYTDGEGE